MWKTNEMYDTYPLKDISSWKMQENVKEKLQISILDKLPQNR